jgi:hypothetical protein
VERGRDLRDLAVLIVLMLNQKFIDQEVELTYQHCVGKSANPGDTQRGFMNE